MTPVMLLSLGLALMGGALAYLICIGISSAWAALRRRRGAAPMHWMVQVESHLRRRKAGIKATVYVALVGFALLAGLATGTVLHNPLAAVLLALIAFIVPEQMFTYLGLRRRLKRFDQLADACGVFAVELGQVGVVKALENTGRAIPDPVGRVFRQAARELSARGDYKKALERMLKELDFTYGRDFALRVLDCYQHSGMSAMFIDMAAEMQEQRRRLHTSIARLFQDRLTTVVILAMFIPAYAVASHVAPTTWEFLTTTVFGKLCMSVYLLAVVLGPVVDYAALRRLEV